MKRYNTVKSQDLTETTRNRLNKVYSMLKTSTTKEEIVLNLDINERVARDLISYIKKKFPVISNSQNKGYRLALSVDDLEDAKQTIAEARSRINDLQEGIKPLEDFVDRIGVVYEEK